MVYFDDFASIFNTLGVIHEYRNRNSYGNVIVSEIDTKWDFLRMFQLVILVPLQFCGTFSFSQSVLAEDELLYTFTTTFSMANYTPIFQLKSTKCSNQK